jgi:putative endonuclease
MVFYVYILLCIDGSFYTGYTKDIDARTRLHQNGKGARYTKAHKPQKLAYTELFDSRGKAMKREREIKKLTHQQNLTLSVLKTRNNFLESLIVIQLDQKR